MLINERNAIVNPFVEQSTQIGITDNFHFYSTAEFT